MYKYRRTCFWSCSGLLLRLSPPDSLQNTDRSLIGQREDVFHLEFWSLNVIFILRSEFDPMNF